MTLGDSVSNDPASAASTLATATALSSDVSHPSVSIQGVKETSWGTAALLDKTSNNYVAWSRHVIHILRLSSSLDLYLDSSFSSPDSHLEPCANHNWKINDTAIQAFLLMKCAPSEHPFVENCVSSHDIWSTLQKRHVYQGPMSQVTLIQEALSVRYSLSTPFANTTLILRDLNWHIWDMGTPNSEGFLCILMLLALSADESLSSVHDAIVLGLSSSTLDHTYTSAEIVAQLDFEQQAHSMCTVPVPAEAHVAKGTCSSDSKQSICSNCKKACHTAEFCIQPGSGMAGKTILEAQQVRDAKHGKCSHDKSDKSKSTSKMAGSIIQLGHQAFIIDADGKAHEIVGSTPSTTSVSSTSESAHYLHTDNLSSIDPLVWDSLCTADIDEFVHIAKYSWLASQDSLHASVDW